MTRADKFYKIHDSTTGRYMNMAALSEDQVMGFATESQQVKDRTCVEGAKESVCYPGTF